MHHAPASLLMTSRQLTEEARITYRQLDYWVRAGYLYPDGGAAGSGSRRGFDPGEVAVAIALRQVVGRGMANDVVRALADQVRQGDLAGTVLLDPDGTPTDTLAEAAWVVQLPHVRALAA